MEDDPELASLPIPRFFEHEGGPYVTAGCIVARDPETGERNWSIARVRPLGGARALVGIAPNHHLAVAGRAARERDRRLPIAVTIGNHPALLVAACLYLARGEDELRVAGALLGEPVELVRCKRVPLEVPAGCEIVLEGELDIGETVEEGPVSEFHGGYERYGPAATATFHCLTRRRDAVYQAILPGFHPEHALIGGVAIAAGLERRLRGLVPSVRAVSVPESGAGRLSAVIALGPHEPVDALTAARAALAAVNLVKLVTVVDDDVDVWDDSAVAHAVATRVLFDRDLHVLAGHARRPGGAARARRQHRQARHRRHAPRGRSRRLVSGGAAAMKLAAGNVVAYLVAREVVAAAAELSVEELTGGVSGTVLAVRGPGVALVVKQALPKLRVAGEWRAPVRRTDTEAAALRLAARLVPGHVPPVVDSDESEHVVVLQHAPPGWRNWQAELLEGRAHAASGRWAGDTLGRLHAATAGDAEVAAAFCDYEAFEALRLQPYHGAVMERIPQLAPALRPLADELRERPHLPRARRLRPEEHPARPRRLVGARHGGRALRPPGLRSGLLPRLPAADGSAAAGAGAGLQRARAGLHDGLRPPCRARGAVASRDRRAHGRDAAGAHRRRLAGGVPRRARRPQGALPRQAAARRAGPRHGGGGGLVRLEAGVGRHAADGGVGTCKGP